MTKVKNEDQGLILELIHTQQKPDMAVYTSNSSVGEVGTGVFLGFIDQSASPTW